MCFFYMQHAANIRDLRLTEIKLCINCEAYVNLIAMMKSTKYDSFSIFFFTINVHSQAKCERKIYFVQV